MCQSGAICLSVDCQYNVSKWSDMSICWLPVQCVRVERNVYPLTQYNVSEWSDMSIRWLSVLCVRVERHVYLLMSGQTCRCTLTHCTDSQQIDMLLHSDTLYWQSADRHVAPLWYIVLTVSQLKKVPILALNINVSLLFHRQKYSFASKSGYRMDFRSCLQSHTRSWYWNIKSRSHTLEVGTETLSHEFTH
jgi:hypothetical protein